MNDAMPNRPDFFPGLDHPCPGIRQKRQDIGNGITNIRNDSKMLNGFPTGSPINESCSLQADPFHQTGSRHLQISREEQRKFDRRTSGIDDQNRFHSFSPQTFTSAAQDHAEFSDLPEHRISGSIVHGSQNPSGCLARGGRRHLSFLHGEAG